MLKAKNDRTKKEVETGTFILAHMCKGGAQVDAETTRAEKLELTAAILATMTPAEVAVAVQFSEELRKIKEGGFPTSREGAQVSVRTPKLSTTAALGAMRVGANAFENGATLKQLVDKYAVDPSKLIQDAMMQGVHVDHEKYLAALNEGVPISKDDIKAVLRKGAESQMSPLEVILKAMQKMSENTK